MAEGTILVTGAAGFIGRAVCAMLEMRGKPFIATDISHHTGPDDGITLCDLTDIHRLYAITDGFAIESIVHCGGVSGPMLARDNPHSLIQSNIMGTANVLEMARQRGVSRLVYSSSASVFGDTPPGPVPEDVPLRPSNVYAASKLAGEHIVNAYRDRYGIDAVSLRLSWVYGPNRRTECVIRTMIQDALAGRPTHMTFGNAVPRQFVHIDDVARAISSALGCPRLPRPTYTITGGEYLTLGELGRIVEQELSGAEIHLDEGPDPEDDIQHMFDISAAKHDLGYVPKIPLREGIRLYADWLAAQQSLKAAS